MEPVTLTVVRHEALRQVRIDLIIEDIKLKAKAWRDAEVIARSANATNLANRHRDKAIVLEQLAHDYETLEGSLA